MASHLRWLVLFSLITSVFVQAVTVSCSADPDYHGAYIPPCPDHFKTIKSSCFDIKYNPDKPAGIDIALENSGFAYDRVADFFKSYPYRTTLELASSHEEYEELVGAGRLPELSMGSGWGDRDRGTIIIKTPELVPNFQTVITHEMTHIATRSYIDGYKYALPQWFEEGLAVYVSEDLDEEKRKAVENRCREGTLMSIGRLEEVHEGSSKFGMDMYDVGIAYTQSGLLIEYISEKYGDDAILQILAEFGRCGDIDSAFKLCIGQPPQEMNEKWQKSLKAELDRRDGVLLEQKMFGYVTDHHGSPLIGQTVQFKALRDDPGVKGTVYSAMTDEKGYYEVNLTYGPIEVSTAKAGYEYDSQTILIQRNDVKVFNITLDGSGAEAKARMAEESAYRNRIYIVLGTINTIAIITLLLMFLRSRRI